MQTNQNENVVKANKIPVNQKTTYTDIAIVGGGMMGATLALMFAKALPALRITLIEANPITVSQNSLPSFDERSTAVSPSTQNALVECGLWSALKPYSSDITDIHISDQGQLGLAKLGPEDNQSRPLGYVIKNSGLGRVLLEAIEHSDIEVLASCRVQTTQNIAGGVCLTFNNREALTAQLLVVADGADSPIRTQLGIGEHVHDYQQHALVANVTFEQPHKNCAYERFTKSGPLALLPLGGPANNEAALVWTWPSDQIEQAKAMSEQQLLNHLQRQFGFRLGGFKRMGARSYYPLALRVAKEQVRSNIVLMGNAAHFLHPVAGQGFNLAVRDGLRLVDVVKAEMTKNVGASNLDGQKQDDQLSGSAKIGSLKSLLTYASAQEQDQLHTIKLSHGFNQLFRQSSWCVPQLRSAGFLLMNILTPVKQQMILLLSGKASSQAQPWT